MANSSHNSLSGFISNFWRGSFLYYSGNDSGVPSETLSGNFLGIYFGIRPGVSRILKEFFQRSLHKFLPRFLEEFLLRFHRQEFFAKFHWKFLLGPHYDLLQRFLQFLSECFRKFFSMTPRRNSSRIFNSKRNKRRKSTRKSWRNSLQNYKRDSLRNCWSLLRGILQWSLVGI